MIAYESFLIWSHTALSYLMRNWCSCSALSSSLCIICNFSLCSISLKLRSCSSVFGELTLIFLATHCSFEIDLLSTRSESPAKSIGSIESRKTSKVYFLVSHSFIGGFFHITSPKHLCGFIGATIFE